MLQRVGRHQQVGHQSHRGDLDTQQKRLMGLNWGLFHQRWASLVLMGRSRFHMLQDERPPRTKNQRTPWNKAGYAAMEDKKPIPVSVV